MSNQPIIKKPCPVIALETFVYDINQLIDFIWHCAPKYLLHTDEAAIVGSIYQQIRRLADVYGHVWSDEQDHALYMYIDSKVIQYKSYQRVQQNMM